MLKGVMVSDSNLMTKVENDSRLIVRSLAVVALLMTVLMAVTHKAPCPSVPVLVVQPGETADNKLAYCLFERHEHMRKFGNLEQYLPLGVCAATRKEALVLLSRHQIALQQKRAACRAKDTSLYGRMMGRT